MGPPVSTEALLAEVSQNSKRQRLVRPPPQGLRTLAVAGEGQLGLKDSKDRQNWADRLVAILARGGVLRRGLRAAAGGRIHGPVRAHRPKAALGAAAEAKPLRAPGIRN